MKKICLFILLSIFFVFSCNEKSDEQENLNNHNNISLELENKAMKEVTALPEYHDAMAHVKAITNDQQSLSSIIEAPNEDHYLFYIQVGYNQETWFEPLYHFYVDPETFQVYIKDGLEDDIITIEAWRQREENR